MPNAQCPMPNAKRHIPNAQCNPVCYRCRGEASCEEDEADRFAQLRSGLRTSVEQAVARQKLVSAILRHPTDAGSLDESALK